VRVVSKLTVLGLVGHLFQGRFKAILVDRGAYLLEVCRYVELNPVRAKMVTAPLDWPWSSYAAHVLQADTPAWLDSDGLHGYLLGRPVRSDADRRRAAQRYAALVAEGLNVALWQDGLRQQIYLGDEDFVARMQALAAPAQATEVNVPKAQRQARKTFGQCLAECGGERNAALCLAYRRHGVTMTALAAQTGLSVSRVSRVVERAEVGT
jgi:putative transposase